MLARMSGFVRDLGQRFLNAREDDYAEHLRQLILPDCSSVLDLGCGMEGALLHRVAGIPHSVGVDLHTPAPYNGKPEPRRHDEYHRLDVRTIADHFPADSYDCVVASDLIEHLEKTEGSDLLDAMERIASKRVIVFTPNGYLYQPATPDNPFQEHLSGWRVGEFVERGYRVIGINGWKPLRTTYAQIRWRPSNFWELASLLTQGITESRPRFAFQLLCSLDV